MKQERLKCGGAEGRKAIREKKEAVSSRLVSDIAPCSMKRANTKSAVLRLGLVGVVCEVQTGCRRWRENPDQGRQLRVVWCGFGVGPSQFARTFAQFGYCVWRKQGF